PLKGNPLAVFCPGFAVFVEFLAALRRILCDGRIDCFCRYARCNKSAACSPMARRPLRNQSSRAAGWSPSDSRRSAWACASADASDCGALASEPSAAAVGICRTRAPWANVRGEAIERSREKTRHKETRFSGLRMGSTQVRGQKSPGIWQVCSCPETLVNERTTLWLVAMKLLWVEHLL